jgi:tRNA-2-methylthio-N6-dimethylallyladenosine synthase
VPYVRGSEVSRSPEDVLDEIKKLVDRGVKEITLLGQNVNSYGQKMHFTTSFAQLLERIAKETRLVRLRFATSHPKDVSDALIEQFAVNPILMPHFHLPAQCGSNRILALMNRGYTQADYLKIIDSVRNRAPQVKFSSDFIVGFPTESVEDFEQTLSLMSVVRFDQTFSFVYSPRPFTQARNIADDVSSTVKSERLKVLQHLDQEITLAQNQKEVGSLQTVLVEKTNNVNPECPNMGRTPGNKQIYFDGACSVGDFVPVKVVEGRAHYLVGQCLRV